MDRNLEQAGDGVSISGKRIFSKGWYLGIGIILIVILFSVIMGVPFILLFLLSEAVVKHPIFYLVSVALLFVISVFGILKSDISDNIKLFYGSVFLFCLSIIGGILYFILPIFYWLATRD